MNTLLTDHIPLHAVREPAWSPSAQSAVSFACSEFTKALRADNIRNRISINFHGIDVRTARELLRHAAFVRSRGECGKVSIDTIHVQTGLSRWACYSTRHRGERSKLTPLIFLHCTVLEFLLLSRLDFF